MRPTKTERLDLSLRSAVGFSLVELMVVVTVIGALAVIGVPRFRTMLARARQAEAKTNLEQIHKLNTLHQTAKDRYAAWGKTDYIGYTNGGGSPHCDLDNHGKASTAGSCRKCATAADNNATTKAACESKTGCVWRPTRPGAKELGFILSACNTWRYRYWIQHTVINGKEHYTAVAYSPSDPDGRIYPTCDGKTSGRTFDLDHPTGNAALDVEQTDVTPNAQGDIQTISEDKQFVHSDIVTVCES